jgi:hypothetical protein
MGTLHEDQYTFLIIYLSVPLRMKNISDKCIVNNNAENIKAPRMLISMKYTQNRPKYTQTGSHTYNIAHSNICTWLFHGKMHSDWFHRVEIVQGRWQHGEEVGCWYPCRLEKTICKWDMYVPRVMKGLLI